MKRLVVTSLIGLAACSHAAPPSVQQAAGPPLRQGVTQGDVERARALVGVDWLGRYTFEEAPPGPVDPPGRTVMFRTYDVEVVREPSGFGARISAAGPQQESDDLLARALPTEEGLELHYVRSEHPGPTRASPGDLLATVRRTPDGRFALRFAKLFRLWDAEDGDAPGERATARPTVVTRREPPDALDNAYAAVVPSYPIALRGNP